MSLIFSVPHKSYHESFLLYLPNVFVAALILLFGYLLGNFFGRAALIASVNAGIKFSGLRTFYSGRYLLFFAFEMLKFFAFRALPVRS